MEKREKDTLAFHFDVTFEMSLFYMTFRKASQQNFSRSLGLNFSHSVFEFKTYVYKEEAPEAATEYFS